MFIRVCRGLWQDSDRGNTMKKLILTVLFTFLAGAPEPFAASNDPLTPKRHFKIEKPGRLSQAEALSVYENVREQMAKGYGSSGDATARDFTQWRRFNTAPYVSATHGNRYVNNYGNATAKGYHRLKKGDKMPAGSILAKDSFTVTQDNALYAGALFVMIKMEVGKNPKNPKTGDWRYQMIMPDGSFLGDSEGEGADKVAFCHGCHKAVKNNDYLFYIPKDFRRQFLD